MTAHCSAFVTQIKRNLLVMGASIPFVAISLFGLWVHRFFKDNRTGIYAVALIVALAVVMHVGIFRVREGPMRLGSAAMRGAIAGYIAGLVAYVALILFVPDGAATLARTVAKDINVSIPLIASFPLVLGGWLYGALVGVVTEWLRGKAEVSHSR